MMTNYTVKLTKPPSGHEVPPLLADVGDWMGQQTHGTLGWFDELSAEAIPKEWNPEMADRLRRDAFAFLSLPDGSLLALVNTGAKAPHAVVLLGSEGEARTVANSLEEFLLLWSQGETELHNEAYPPIPKTSKTFIPYVSFAWVRSMTTRGTPSTRRRRSSTSASRRGLRSRSTPFP